MKKLFASRMGRAIGVGLTIAAGVAGYSCGAGQTEVNHHGIQTPLSQVSGAPASATTSAVTSPTPSVQLGPVERSEYEPLLNGAGYAHVREALDEEQPAKALKAFGHYLDSMGAAERSTPVLLFQLGRLSLLASDYRGAAQAFAKCSAQAWALSDYCRYFQARAELALGANQRALNCLLQVTDSVPSTLAPGVRRLRGQAAFLAQDDTAAIRELRADLAAQPRASGWTQSALLLARALTRSPAAAGASSAIVPILPVVDRAVVVEVLTLLRRVSTEAAGTTMAKEALALEKAVLATLPKAGGQAWQAVSPEQQLARVTSLVESRQFPEALAAAEKLLEQLPESERFTDLACEAQLARGKALAGKGEWGTAVDQLTQAIERCTVPELRARLMFVSGKYAVADKRFAQAVRLYAQLEQQVPNSSLADDARLKQAEAYLELGDEAEFTRLLGTVSEDYPAGDMALDGAFRLAIRRVEKLDWAGAANVLERALPRARLADRVRDQEYAGRERYFLARAWIETGEVARGLSEYEALIRELPFSFYMQLALSRLTAADKPRADAAKQLAMSNASSAGLEQRLRARVNAPGFERALALLKQGETTWAEAELNALPTTVGQVGLDLSWINAHLFAVSGEAKLAHQLVRSGAKDWLSRWPVGEWRQVWELAFPRPHLALVVREAARNQLREALVYAVMREESGFESNAESPAKAFGLMQLIRPTAKRFAKELGLKYTDRSLFRPAVNIALGSRALRTFQDAFPANPVLAIPGYNAGPGRPRRWLKESAQLDFDVWVELIPFTETRRYTKRVLSSVGSYEFLYGDGGSDWMLPVTLNGPAEQVASADR